VDINPAAAVHRNTRYQPDALVIRYAGGDLTGAQLDDRAARLASVLAKGGVALGDRVAYLGLNSPAFLITMLAAFRLGAIFVPVDSRLAGPELRGVLQRSGASTIICEEGHRAAVEAVREQTALKRFPLVNDDPEAPPTPRPPKDWKPWSRLLRQAAPTTSLAHRRFDDSAILMFTSGTTGRPKGVILTHGNIWWNCVNVDSRLDTRRGPGARRLRRRSVPPAHHRRGRGTGTSLLDPAVRRARHLPAAGLGAHRDGPVRHPPSRGAHAGQAGLGGDPHALHRDPRGRPATNEPVGPRTRGEVVVRGPNIVLGYWEDWEATRAAFDDEGWFHSGDIGYLDEDGCLFIVDRLKDMIISGGENVYPAEVERALADMPGLIDVAIIGIPDRAWGETVVAVVSLAEGAAVTLADVREYAAAQLTHYKLPPQLRVVATVPRNASGKLDKPAIRQMITGES
jgi:fatty-acyl-CoA synthase